MLIRETRQQNRENGRLRRELEWSQGLEATVRRLTDEARLLRGELAGYHDQMDIIDAQSSEAFHLRMALTKSDIKKQELEARLAERPLLPAAVRGLRQRDKTIELLRVRNERLEEELAKLRSSRAVLSKAAFGSRSERQKKPGTGRKRGQQRGAPGHGRTPRPGLRETKERHNPPKDARICSCCGKPYVANGERSTSLIEIEVKAHIRRIERPRWRRGCECASSPLEVVAPPVPRLFPGTLFGTSFWARFLFEHCACLRPLCRVAAWYADQGLPVSPGTLANSLKRFVPLFDPLYEAILAPPEPDGGAPCRRDRLAGAGVPRQRPVEPRLAVDFGQQGRGLLPYRPLAQRRGREDPVRRHRLHRLRCLRPLQRLQSAGRANSPAR